MLPFAAAYQHETNDAWLDDLVRDISHRPRNSTANCNLYGRDWDDDMVDDPAGAVSENGAVSPSISASARQSRSPVPHSQSRSRRHLRSHSGGSSPSSSLWVPTPQRRSSLRSRTTSPFARPETRLSRYQGIPEDQPYDDFYARAEDVAPSRLSGYSESHNVKSLNAIVEDSYRGRADRTSSLVSSHIGPEGVPPPYTPTRPDTAYLRDGRQLQSPSSFTTVNKDGKLIPRAPTGQSWYSVSQRSGSPEEMPALLRGTSMASMASQFHEFPAHPGVRPLKSREMLGEAAGPDDDEDAEYPAPFPLTLIIIGICLSVFIISVNRNQIATAVPAITARFHSYDDIGWYGSAYLLTASAFQPLYGRIYMSFETKWSYLAALAVFEVGSLICGVSPSSTVLILGRAIQGLGSAGILTGSFVVGTHSVPIQQRPILFAGVGVLFGVGALFGPMLGGIFTDLANWRWCFYVNLPVGGVTFLTVLLCFKPQHRKEHRKPFFQRLWALDWVGNMILLGSCTMLFLALQYSESKMSWNSALPIGLIVGFGVSLIIFVGWMFYKRDEALIPVHIVRQRTVAASCGAAFFIYGALLLQAYYLPIWFQAIQGDSAIHSGVNMVPYMVVNAFFSLFAGIFVSKNGLFAPPAIIGCAIGTVGAGLLATLKPTSSVAQWAGYEIIVAAGLGMAIQQGFSAVQTALPLHEVPIGTAAVVACQSIGGAIFVSVGNTLLQNHLLNENIANRIPGVNIRAVIELGATQFRAVIPPADLPALIELYNDALQAAFIAAVPLCGCAFFCSLCMEWRSVRNGHLSKDASGADVKEKKYKGKQMRSEQEKETQV